MTTFTNQEAPINQAQLMAVIADEKVQAEARKQAHLEKVHHNPERIDPRICWSDAVLHELVRRETGMLFTHDGWRLLNSKEGLQYTTPAWLYTEFKNAYHPRPWTQAEAIAWMEENAHE